MIHDHSCFWNMGGNSGILSLFKRKFSILYHEFNDLKEPNLKIYI